MTEEDEEKELIVTEEPFDREDFSREVIVEIKIIIEEGIDIADRAQREVR